MDTMTQNNSPLLVSTFNSFHVNQPQSFHITLAPSVKPNELSVNITNPIIGPIDKQVKWQSANIQQQSHNNKCIVTFRAPIVGIYNINIELLKPFKPSDQNSFQFQAKAYDLSKVFINGSSGRCIVNESYEFGVDASEAGEGQLEIAVNEGDIPNQVQVLDNGKCIVNFVPEEVVHHVVDIKFNGHNVNGCPFIVQVDPKETPNSTKSNILGEPHLIKIDKILINSLASITLENINLNGIDKDDILILDPINKALDHKITKDDNVPGRFIIEFQPSNVGDYSVELKPKSRLAEALTPTVLEEFPFVVRVFDQTKVIVSEITNGVIGHPIYFFIDASQAGSGNLEIRVSSKTRNVPNYPQSEANAKIRVNFTPTEAVDHTIDVKFNGISVPNNPFLVRVAQKPQARIPLTSQDVLNYVPINETVEFYVDLIDSKNTEQITDTCIVSVIKPDWDSIKLDDVQLVKATDKNDKSQNRFKIKFKPAKIGPYKLFIIINNEILPGSPLLSNVYNIEEVKVYFDQKSAQGNPVGTLNKPVLFTVDASHAGEGTLALAVVSSLSKTPVQTDVQVSEKGHGLYNLTFVPNEFAVHSIDMSFNDRVVPNTPFIVDVLDDNGESAMSKVRSANVSGSTQNETALLDETVMQDFSAMSLKGGKSTKNKATALTKEDDLIESIVVHGVSLKRTPVNSTGAFIIETNGLAHARDFDVLIADPNNSLVDVQCYLQQDGNLLAEWTPEKVGRHRIEVLYRNTPVPGSPFTTHAFDPSAISVEYPKIAQLLVGEVVELRINRSNAGSADLEVMLTDPNGDERVLCHIPVKTDSPSESYERVEFKPQCSGKYRVSITLGGYEIPKSPITLKVYNNEKPVKVNGNGLRCAEINRSAHFDVESVEDGELKLRIECGEREIVPKVERLGKSYNIKYKPTEVGYAIISLYWNGSHIEGSPFSVPVNDLSKFSFIHSASNGQTNNQIALDYEPRLAREIIMDTTKCGPGELKAEAYCRANANIKFTIPVNQLGVGCYKLIFICPPGPEQLASCLNLKEFPIKATYMIRFYFNNLAVPETLASVTLSPKSDKSPMNGTTNGTNSSTARSIVQKLGEQSLLNDQHVVSLRGHGLAEAKCGEIAEFTIDGRSIGRGEPEVKLCNHSGEVQVDLDLIENGLYKATYVAKSEGIHTLNVLWAGEQVAGCPISVDVKQYCDPNRVICTADSLKGGVLGEEIKTFIDTRKAGPGELTALCTGPTKVAFCELLDRGDGTFVLYIKPQEAGRHSLTINYGGQHIPKSPFPFKVSGKPDPTKVRVYGPGVEHGVLSLYQSRFVCDTRGAGAGQLTVRIRGPKGAFRMETQRESQRDRTILCKYDPTEPGDYRIEIKWSGRHVPGSPFSVMIFDTQEELNRFLMSQQQDNKKVGLSSNLATPFQPTLVEYGHYSNNTSVLHRPKFRLQ